MRSRNSDAENKFPPYPEFVGMAVRQVPEHIIKMFDTLTNHALHTLENGGAVLFDRNHNGDAVITFKDREYVSKLHEGVVT